jgi:hypothetical protein
MPLPTRSLYAIDPSSQKVRLVVQVTPDGWSEDELETTLASLIPILGSAAIPIAILVSSSTAFVIRFDDKTSHFDVDEVDTADVVAPLPLGSDRSTLFDTISQWFHQVANHWQDFVPRTTLPKRVPEIVPLIVGSHLRERDGSIGIPSDQTTRPVETH